MQVLIASDIHGVNERVRNMFIGIDDKLAFLSPWEGDGCPYQSEAEAVEAFHKADGLSVYQRKIAHAAKDQPTFLIGLSVGAASMWLYAASEQCHPQSRAVLFYGSRIRDHHALLPRCEVSLVFAEREASFSPGALVSQFARSRIDAKVIEGTSHGFMNPLSTHYREDLALDQIEQLRRIVQEWRRATYI